MPKYHILPANAEWSRYRRGKTQTTLSLCGEVVRRWEDGACNISIATPEWDYNWRHDCVLSVHERWTDAEKEIWRKKGIVFPAD